MHDEDRRDACALVAAAAAGVLPVLTAGPVRLIGLVSVAFGLSGGSWTPLHLTALADEGGEDGSGLAVGLGMAFGSVGAALTPPLFGRAADLIGTYTPAWQGLAVLAAIAAALAIALRERVGSEQWAVCREQ